MKVNRPIATDEWKSFTEFSDGSLLIWKSNDKQTYLKLGHTILLNLDSVNLSTDYRVIDKCWKLVNGPITLENT